MSRFARKAFNKVLAKFKSEKANLKDEGDCDDHDKIIVIEEIGDTSIITVFDSTCDTLMRIEMEDALEEALDEVDKDLDTSCEQMTATDDKGDKLTSEIKDTIAVETCVDEPNYQNENLIEICSPSSVSTPKSGHLVHVEANTVTEEENSNNGDLIIEKTSQEILISKSRDLVIVEANKEEQNSKREIDIVLEANKEEQNSDNGEVIGLNSGKEHKSKIKHEMDNEVSKLEENSKTGGEISLEPGIDEENSKNTKDLPLKSAKLMSLIASRFQHAAQDIKWFYTNRQSHHISFKVLAEKDVEIKLHGIVLFVEEMINEATVNVKHVNVNENNDLKITYIFKNIKADTSRQNRRQATKKVGNTNYLLDTMHAKVHFPKAITLIPGDNYDLTVTLHGGSSSVGIGPRMGFVTRRVGRERLKAEVYFRDREGSGEEKGQRTTVCEGQIPGIILDLGKCVRKTSGHKY